MVGCEGECEECCLAGVCFVFVDKLLDIEKRNEHRNQLDHDSGQLADKTEPEMVELRK